MDGPKGKRSEISQTNIVWFHLHVESKKQNKTKQKQTFGYREMVVARGDVGGRTAKIDEGD